MLIRKMLFIVVLCSLGAAVYSSNSYQKIEKTKLYTLRLDIPKEILPITPLKNDLLERFKVASNEIKKNANEVKSERQGYFPPLTLETKWQVTFENAAVLSVSGMSYEYQGGAHPDTYFEAVVWDKKSRQAIPITNFFNENQTNLALKAIAEEAQKSWIKIYSERSHEAPTADLIEQSKQGIKPEAQFLKNYVLTHSKGAAKANGIMLLYGTGEIWPYVLGEFRIPVSQATFYQYLKPEWRSIFSRGD